MLTGTIGNFFRQSLYGVYKHSLGRVLGWGLTINYFGFPAGHSPVPSPARHYIDTFLTHYDDAVHGRVVEFMPPYYRDRYQHRPTVTDYEVWDTVEAPGATIVGDLQAAGHLPDGCFNTFLCTHVLCNVPRPWLAVQEMHRLLAPGGVVLCTVPMVLQGYAPHPGDYWRMTPDSLRLLFADFTRIEIHTYGNAATASGSPQYLMKHHFSPQVLDFHDPGCPSIVACAAWK
ncbi:MAG: class I SAM-dependent methyltransferase [Ferrovibrio sp.]|uniref:class I SAM-dependent methyltransferase n=1 Tax=Ferrovibrio sp. TaxID=1917215 RepID=UPI00391C2AC1